MAFPTITDTQVTKSWVNGSTDHTINLPTTVYAGDLLVVFVIQMGGETDPLSMTGGFVWQESAAAVNWSGSHMFTKVADGSEGGTSETITMNVTSGHSVTAYALSISGVNGGNVRGTDWDATSGDYGTNICDPGTLTVGFPQSDILWLLWDARADSGGALDTLTTWPASYTDNQFQDNDTSGSYATQFAFATKNKNGSSDSPEDFVWDVSGSDKYVFMAIRPGTSGGAPPPPATDLVKVWNGSALVDATCKVWNGSALVDANANISLSETGGGGAGGGELKYSDLTISVTEGVTATDYLAWPYGGSSVRWQTRIDQSLAEETNPNTHLGDRANADPGAGTDGNWIDMTEVDGKDRIDFNIDETHIDGIEPDASGNYFYYYIRVSSDGSTWQPEVTITITT